MKGVFLVVALVSGSAALGQTQRASDEARAQRVTELSFDSELVEATIDRPNVELIQAIRGGRHEPLIRTRTEFRDRVLQSASEL